MKMIIEIIIDALKIALKWLEKHLRTILYFLYFVFSIISIVFFENSTKKQWVIGLTILFFGIVVLDYIQKELNKKKQLKLKPKERYTIKSSNGDVSIKENRLNQAIIYLSILEDEIW